jgi:ADP-dependent NAD(P)H-hydrate dehydratase / NAD(P)H-hydrate epimerase
MPLLHRSPASNKGDHGTLGILGGATGTVGAAFLAARAALFSGAGRVFVVRPSLSDGYVLDSLAPEIMVIDAGQAKSKPINCWLAGPGLGMSDAAHQLLADVLAKPFPLVIDADALNLMAEDPALGRQCARRSAPTIITPHPGEASRLLELSVDRVQADRDQAARHLSKRFNAIAVLKGAGTVICAKAGNTQVNTTGNAALATAGSGDVLAGFMASLIAQGLEPLTAACESVRIHGLAAEQLTEHVGGMLGITASELVPVIRKLLNE